MSIRVKRVYEPPDASDGSRILVDRLWPRGISKEKARIDEWMKEIAPSDALRKWFGHAPERWDGFQKRYRNELQSPEKQALLRQLRAKARKSDITLLFAAKEETMNNARALVAFLRGAR